MAFTDLATRLFSFDEFEVSLHEGELRRCGSKVPLQEKPFQLLVLLLERAGEMVSREDLRQTLWPSGTHVDFDKNLNVAVAKLRRALADLAVRPKYIETVGSRGYRFLSPVQERDQIPAGGRRKARLAVLPFEDLSPSPAQTFFADGITDEIITQLGHLYRGQLGVISRTSTMKYRDRKKRIQQIGRELGADYILEGSVRRAGERIRITAMLIRARDETSLWCETFEDVPVDLLACQIELARRIAQSLGLELLPSQAATVSRRSTASEAARLAYFRGRYHQSKRTEEGLRKSVESFQEAIQQDAAFALAYSALAESKSFLGSMGYGGGRPNEFFPAAKEAALQAFRMNDTLAEVYVALATVAYLYEWDWSSAEKHLLRAIELNPSHPPAHRLYAHYLTSRARHDEAIQEARRARELDPLTLITNNTVATSLLLARRYEEALEEFHRTLELESNFVPTLMMMSIAYEQQARFAEAESALEQAHVNAQGNTTPLGWLASFQARAGKPSKARALLAELEAISRKSYVPAYHFALTYAGLGKREDALAWLEAAFRERSPFLAFPFNVDPRFESLRSDPQFRDLVMRVGA